MKSEPYKILNPQKYEVATEVLSSAVRVLQAIGFSEVEIPLLFDQVIKRGVRAPVWLDPVD